MLTFRSSGDIGDIVSALPTIRYFGGGALLIEAADYTRQRLTRDKWCGIDLLLKQQPYIQDVREWNREMVSICLNDFRANMFRAMRKPDTWGMFKDKPLCDWIMDAHGVPLDQKNTPWLAVEPNKVARVVINRTGPGRAPQHVYHNPLFPWHRVWQKYKDQAVFIGSPFEHEVFCQTCGDIRYHPTENLLEAARVIAGSDLYIGNQSVCFWIAEAMKKNLILEVWPSGPNSLSHRPGAIMGWDQNVVLPDL